MNGKTTVKWILDVLMTAALLFLMGYQFWGQAAHEWVGAGMFLLFLLHQGFNWKWYRNLFRGKYTPLRIFQLCVNVLTLIAMLLMMYSGIVLSRSVFAFLPINSGLALARLLHILGSHWGFLLMSLHLGLHWNMVLGMVRKKVRLSPSRVRTVILFLIGLAIAGYGVYAFLKRGFFPNLFLQNQFIFLDYEEPIPLFYCDYLAFLGTCVFAAHYMEKIFKTGFPWKPRGTKHT